MAKEASVHGVLLWNTPPADLAAIHAAIVAGLDVGSLTPVVGKEIPLSEAARAHREVLEPGALGKIVLVP
jgi:NADPH2:quinone reductase